MRLNRHMTIAAATNCVFARRSKIHALVSRERLAARLAVRMCNQSRPPRWRMPNARPRGHSRRPTYLARDHARGPRCRLRMRRENGGQLCQSEASRIESAKRGWASKALAHTQVEDLAVGNPHLKTDTRSMTVPGVERSPTCRVESRSQSSTIF